MVFRTSAHAAYDTAYHLVWSPKYRKKILTGAIAKRVEEMFREIAESYDITIDEMEGEYRPCAHLLFVSAALLNRTDCDPLQEFVGTRGVS